MKTLVLTANANMYYFPWFQDPDIEIASLYQDCTTFRSKIRLVRRKLGLSQRSFYGDWYERLLQFGKIVVLDYCCLLDAKLLGEISRMNSSAELYLYGWNIDYGKSSFISLKENAERHGFSYYSYDEGICARYGLKFNTIMCDPKLSLPECNIASDVMFVGKVKDRIEDISRAVASLRDAGAKVTAIVMGDHKPDDLDAGVLFTSEYIGYADYLRLAECSVALLDIAQEGQLGFSMRVMEALFLGKKLVTTNKHVADAPFYESGNVFILDLANPDIAALSDFINKPFRPYELADVEYYSVRSWVSRFMQ